MLQNDIIFYSQMGYQMIVCAFIPHVTLIVMRNVYFMNEQWNQTSSTFMRQLVVLVWHNVGIVAKMRLAMHALAVFKKLERYYTLNPCKIM